VTSKEARDVIESFKSGNCTILFYFKTGMKRPLRSKGGGRAVDAYQLGSNQ